MCGPLRIGVLGASRSVCAAYTELVRHGVPMPTDSNDAVRTMELIDECYRAVGLESRPRHRPPTEGA